MLKLKRIQMMFHTSEGEVYTTTRLEFSNYSGEFLPTATIALLTGKETKEIEKLCRGNTIRMRDRNGCQWVDIHNSILLMSLILPSDYANMNLS